MGYWLALLMIYSYISLSKNFPFTLLHLGDIRGKFLESSPQATPCHEGMKKRNMCSGGIARVAYVVKEYRQMAKDGKIPPVVFLSNGNHMQGGTLASIYSYNITSDFMNLLELDCVSLGVHEFDKGVSMLREYVRRLKMPVVLTNVKSSTLPSGVPIVKSHVISVKGVLIGIVGYVTRELKAISLPETIEPVDEIPALTEEATKLQNSGIKIIIALGCSGMSVDERVAANVPYVDIVIGGMSTLLFYTGRQPGYEKPVHNYPYIVVQKNGKKVAVVYAYAFTKYIGYLNVTFTPDGRLDSYNGNPIYLGPNAPEDKEALALREVYTTNSLKSSRISVGNSSVILEGSEVCAVRECNLGNLLTDATVAYAATKFRSVWTQAPIGITHNGLMKVNIDTLCVGGNIFMGDLNACMPYTNNFAKVSMLGKHLQLMLEMSMQVDDRRRTELGSFLQVSGLRVVYIPLNEPLHRVKSVRVRCGQCPVPRYELLVPNKVYNIVMPTFLVEGHEGFQELLPHRAFDIELLNITDIEVMTWYFARRSPVHPELQGRITMVNLPKNISMASQHACILSVNLLFPVFRYVLM